MKTRIAKLLRPALCLALAPAFGQAAGDAAKVTLRNGTTLESRTVKGASHGYVEVDRPLAPGVVAQVAYDPRTVDKIEFPENPRLKRAMELLEKGRPAAALALINPVFESRQKLAAVRGNDAAASAVIKVKALAGLKREQEAQELIDQLTHNADDPEVIRAALVEVMAVWARTGQYQKADNYFDKAIAESTNPQTIATAWCRKGDSLLAIEQFDAALLAYLRVPTLYADQDSILPAALLGAARAYLGLEDKAHATTLLKKILQDSPASPEAVQAKLELEKIQNGASGAENLTSN